MHGIKIALGFANGLGNFLFLSAAVKVLRKWGYDYIGLITDAPGVGVGRLARNYKYLEEIGSDVFDTIEYQYDDLKYHKLILFRWSVPVTLRSILDEYIREPNIIKWDSVGIHEVQAYLYEIGASWQDFDGYILNVADKPILKSPDKKRIALANPSGSNQADKKRWSRFPELSRMLESLGYEVILLGAKGELEGCVGTNYTGRLGIKQSAKVLEQCDLLIAASTALTVVADAVGIPVVLLEGPMYTARAHPLQVPFRVVRKYISCAPCFQTNLWKMCKSPECMNMIQVKDVLIEMEKLMVSSRRNAYERRIESVELISEKSKPSEHTKDKKVAYAFPCFNRHYTLSSFVKSFCESDLLPGTLFVWNDGSVDPRVKKLMTHLSGDDRLKLAGIDVKYYETHMGLNKFDYCRKVTTRVWNMLLGEINVVRSDFDYVAFLDSDMLLHKNWLYRSINVFCEAKKQHLKLWSVSAFDSNTDILTPGNRDVEVYETKFGEYQLRGKVSACYLIDSDFLPEFGMFNQTTKSSDIGKSQELLKKGFSSVVLKPPLAEHLGAMDSSIRIKVGASSKHFMS